MKKKPAPTVRKNKVSTKRAQLSRNGSTLRVERNGPKKRASPSGNTPGNRDQRLRFVELLLGISQKLSGMDTLDEVLTGLVEVTTRELNAERGSQFLNDPASNELYSRVAQGTFHREICILNNSGIAGHVFSVGKGVIIDDAYADPRFYRSVDEQTGFVTRSILCVPVRTVKVRDHRCGAGPEQTQRCFFRE